MLFFYSYYNLTKLWTILSISDFSIRTFFMLLSCFAISYRADFLGLLWMLSLSSYEAMDAISSEVLIPATVMLFIAVLVFAFNVSASSFSSY